MAEILGVGSPLTEILAGDEQGFLEEWVADLRSSKGTSGSIGETELKEQAGQFFHTFRNAIQAAGQNADVKDAHWNGLREFLAEISRTRAVQGFTATETATFVFSFKQPLFRRMREMVRDPAILAEQMWGVSELLDSLGLYTSEVFLKTREEAIRRGQEDMLELSTPVIKLWKGILALPLIGTLDSARTQVVMETLLEAIVSTNSRVAIIDITGVPTVDTMVAQHLLKTITAARLMGADCIISGIRPQIAQTIVHLGIDLMEVTSKATLSAAFAVALERTGQRLTVNE